MSIRVHGPCLDWSALTTQRASYTSSLLANLTQPREPHWHCCRPVSRFDLHFGDGGTPRRLHQGAVVGSSSSSSSSRSMASSPLSVPGTASPLSSDEDIARALSPSFEHAHTMATHNSEAEGMMKPNAPATLPVKTTSADDEVDKAAKGKEKAAKGPLKLLDLPVDVLKEIIHQVCSNSSAAQHNTLLCAFGFRSG
jgi:hypothetical protein